MTIKDLDKLTTKDTYSLLLFALYKLKDNPKYSTLSELTYILDKNSFLSLVEYFGGLTITIPAISEIRILLNALLVYNYVNIEKTYTLDKALNILSNDHYSRDDILEAYAVICDVLKNYDFGNQEADDNAD